MRKIRVLLIGQLPKEAGGNYTTGIAKVVSELCKYSEDGFEQFLYATNVKDKVAANVHLGNTTVYGYRFLLARVFFNILSHPHTSLREWRHYRKVCHKNPLRFEIYKANFQRVIELVHPDIIHHHGDGIAPLHFALNNRNIPVLRTYHGMMYKGTEETKQYRDDAIGNKDFADFNTALTEDNKKEVARLGIPEDRIDVIPNGNDTSTYYYSSVERSKVRSDYNVEDNTIVFLTVGVVVNRKGQFRFLQTLKDLPIKYNYWIIGKGPDEERIRDYVKDNGLEDNVKLLGYIDMHNMYKYLSAADVFAHVSFSEGQSLAEIEAYSTGLKEIINNRIAGTVAGDAYNNKDIYYIIDFDNVDSGELVEWINRRDANRHSRTNLDWRNITKMYAREYGKVLRLFNNEQK